VKRYWFIVFEWWCPGSSAQTGNEVWQGEHPLDRLAEKKDADHQLKSNYTHRLIFYAEIDEALYFKHRLTV